MCQEKHNEDGHSSTRDLNFSYQEISYNWSYVQIKSDLALIMSFEV
jgi:hypothetical protein